MDRNKKLADGWNAEASKLESHFNVIRKRCRLYPCIFSF
jgi:hypothetical protein